MTALSNAPVPQPGRTARTPHQALGLLGFVAIVFLLLLVWRCRHTSLSEVPTRQLVSIWSEDGQGQPCRKQPVPAVNARSRLPDTTLAVKVEVFVEREWLGRKGTPPDAIWHQVRTARGKLCWVQQPGLLMLDGGLSFPRGTPMSETQAGLQMLERARTWIADEAAYGGADIQPGNGQRDGHRTDVAGYVSYAWGLRSNAAPYSTTAAELGDYAREISLEALAPGDVLNNQRLGETGRVVLFVRWRGPDKRAFEAFVMSREHGKAVHTVLTLTEFQPALARGGWTIAEYEAAAPGPYVAQRRVRTGD